MGLNCVGADWLAEKIDGMAEDVPVMSPVKFNEENRYLPAGVSPRPGYIRYDLFPFLREIIDCFDPRSPVREANVLKGVQVGYTTLLESILLYYIAHVKTSPAMFLTADKELAAGRVENNILPMINQSGFAHLIQSHDEGNSRKTGKTKDFIQWDGGGFMIYNGAMNAAKMRQYSVPLMLKDELDGWKRSIGQDGDSDTLTDARLSAYWTVRKILRGSTPLLAPSMISDAYEKGDCRKYLVLCKACSYPQELRMEAVNKETGIAGGFHWDMDDGSLVLESVRYACTNCGHEHYETDKERLFATEHGAHWKPTKKPKEPGIRSYHLPSFYSPFGFRPWYKCISDYIEAFDTETKSVKNVAKMQEFYNNTLGKAFKPLGASVSETAASAHRRVGYTYGQVPNVYADEFSPSKILFLTCQVDVHKNNLAVSVMGWTRDACCYLIEYKRLEDDDCTETASPVWQKLRELIEEKRYAADDGREYGITVTLIDAGYANDTVTTFCSEYTAAVYPILGRERPAKNQKISEFAQFTTQAGTVGYRILVDHYKDRMSVTLRRVWAEDTGQQNRYHFNCPVDTTQEQLKELTVEIRREKQDPNGGASYYWHRPGNARNELWDLLGYGYAAVEILAWEICVKHFELETIDWNQFWTYISTEQLFFTHAG